MVDFFHFQLGEFNENVDFENENEEIIGALSSDDESEVNQRNGGADTEIYEDEESSGTMLHSSSASNVADSNEIEVIEIFTMDSDDVYDESSYKNNPNVNEYFRNSDNYENDANSEQEESDLGEGDDEYNRRRDHYYFDENGNDYGDNKSNRSANYPKRERRFRRHHDKHEYVHIFAFSLIFMVVALLLKDLIRKIRAESSTPTVAVTLPKINEKIPLIKENVSKPQMAEP